MKLNKSSHCAATRTQLVDAVIEGYVTWREESIVVDATYQTWNRADRQQRESAFAAYLIALDREEDAASAYRHLVEQVGAEYRAQT